MRLAFNITLNFSCVNIVEEEIYLIWNYDSRLWTHDYSRVIKQLLADYAILCHPLSFFKIIVVNIKSQLRESSSFFKFHNYIEHAWNMRVYIFVCWNKGAKSWLSLRGTVQRGLLAFSVIVQTKKQTTKKHLIFKKSKIRIRVQSVL